MTDPTRIELVEDRIPLEGLRDAAVDLVRMYGGSVASEADQQINFVLPSGRGAGPASEIDCRITWAASSPDEATVTLSASRESERPRPQQILILVAGVIGAVLWLLWPFFPHLGTASWVGAVIAFAAYFMTLKRTSGGIAADLLQRLARIQRDRVVTTVP